MYISKLFSIQMSYYDAILTSNFTLDIPGSFEIESGIMVHIELYEGQYYLIGYYTNGVFVVTSPQSIEANILSNIIPSAGVLSQISEAPDPQGPYVPKPEPRDCTDLGIYNYDYN